MTTGDLRVGRYMAPAPHTIGQDQTLARAHDMMRTHGIRHLPVLQAGKLVGIVSARDLYFIETLRDVDAASVAVEEAMTQAPYVVSPDTPLEEVADNMAEHHYGCAVVIEHGGVVGIFTTVDGMRTLANILHDRRKVEVTGGPRAEVKRDKVPRGAPDK